MSTNRKISTVKQFAKQNPAFSENSLRYHIFNSEERENSIGDKVSGNGMIEAGAIVRLGSRVYINDSGFFKWIYKKTRKEYTAVLTQGISG